MTDVLHEPTLAAPATPPPVRRPWYRRPLVIVPIVVAVVAAAIVTTVLLVVNDPVKVHGTVLDSVTGNAVAGATISAGDRTATADDHGVFALDNVAKDATVTVSAANYTPVEIKATTAAVVVRLAPIPVRVTVTSALTGAGLSATLTAPDGARTATDSSGVATAYRVGPSDKITVGAEGYTAATVVVGGDRTIAATLRPTFATVAGQLEQWAAAKQDDKIINWVLSPATEFRYGPIPEITGIPPGVWVAGREVVGQDAAVVLALVPGLGLEQEVFKDLFSGKPEQFVVAGQQAWHGAFAGAQGTFASVWAHQPLLIMIVSTDLSTTDKVLNGIVAAQPSS